MSKKAKIEVQDHWYKELSKLRYWLDGFKTGRQAPGTPPMLFPGEDTLRQIQVAISGAVIHKELVDKKDKK